MFASATWMSESKASQYHRRNHRCATRLRVRHRFRFASFPFVSRAAASQASQASRVAPRSTRASMCRANVQPCVSVVLDVLVASRQARNDAARARAASLRATPAARADASEKRAEALAFVTHP